MIERARDQGARRVAAGVVWRLRLLEAGQRVAKLGSWEWFPDRDEQLWSDNLYRIFGLKPREITPTRTFVLKQTGRRLSATRSPTAVAIARSPAAIVGMKPPQFAVWIFQQLGARPGDQLVDLYPGSGAIAETWRRYAGTLATTGQSDGTAELQAGVDDARDVAARAETEHAAHGSDLAVVGREQGRTCPVNGAWCESLACIDVGCTAEDANDVDAERAA